MSLEGSRMTGVDLNSVLPQLLPLETSAAGTDAARGTVYYSDVPLFQHLAIKLHVNIGM